MKSFSGEEITILSESKIMIQITDIKKSFGSLQVLKGISLDIHKGEVVSIVGPSGAGKTTLLQMIGTLDKPDSGRFSSTVPM